jgi:hypothetical protein
MIGKSYQGHPSWTAWNVSLWIANDEGLYNLARECARYARRHRQTKPEAAQTLLVALKCAGLTHTPDGARYSKTTILHAMRGLE